GMNLDLTYTDEDGTERFFKETMNELKDTYEDATESYKQTMQESFDENLDDIYREVKSEGFANVNQFPIINEDGSVSRMDTDMDNMSIVDVKEIKNSIQY